LPWAIANLGSIPAHDPSEHALGLDPGSERLGEKIIRLADILSAMDAK
jgi:hypothetical protein